jgi:hypothetical protein
MSLEEPAPWIDERYKPDEITGYRATTIVAGENLRIEALYAILKAEKRPAERHGTTRFG